MRNIAESPRRGDSFHHPTFGGGCTVRAMRCFVRKGGGSCVSVHLIPDVGVTMGKHRCHRTWSIPTWGDLYRDAELATQRAALQGTGSGSADNG